MNTEDKLQRGTPEEKANELTDKYGKMAPYVCEDILNETEGYKIEWWREVFNILKQAA